MVQQASEGKVKRSGALGWRVVFWVAVVVCVASLAALAYILWTYWAASQAYKDIADKAFDPPVADVVATQPVSSSAASEDPVQELPLMLGDLSVDWEYLRSVNPDVVGWIYIPDTVVNYPIVHTTNNDTYLYTDFNGATGGSARGGAIFLDANDHGDFSDQNNVIYGHHMNDGSMFACLSLQLTDNAEFNSHRTIYILTPTMNYRCSSFAVIKTDGWDLLVQTAFASAEERTSYITDKQQRSVVQPDEGMPDPAGIPKLVTLSTCDYSTNNGRAVLFAQILEQAVPGSDTSSTPVDDLVTEALEEGVSEAA